MNFFLKTPISFSSFVHFNESCILFAQNFHNSFMDYPNKAKKRKRSLKLRFLFWLFLFD